jgi:hypothetical protein
MEKKRFFPQDICTWHCSIPRGQSFDGSVGSLSRKKRYLDVSEIAGDCGGMLFWYIFLKERGGNFLLAQATAKVTRVNCE